MRKFLGLLAVSFLLAAPACSSGGDSTDDAKGSTSTTGSTTTTEPTTEDTTTDDTAGSDDPDKATPGEDEYLAALTSGMEAGGNIDGDFEFGDASPCLAEKWLDVIGIDALVDAEVELEELEDADFDYGQLELDEDQAEAMLKAMYDCDVDVRSNVVYLLTDARLDDRSEATRACTSEKLSDDIVDEFVVAALSGGDPSPEADAAIAAMDACKQAG